MIRGMASVFGKLNLKGQDEIVVLNAPASFEPELASLSDVRIKRSIGDVKAIAFSLAFVTKQKEVDAIANAVAKKTAGDAIVWFAYPKKSSKRYTSELGMGTDGWAPLGEVGFEPVRMIAIDEDWTAVRFRRAGFIKTLTRDTRAIMSKEGKAKARLRSR
jgi:hypothetical protein